MTCQECGDTVDELITVRVGRKKRRLCEDCAEDVQQQAEIDEEAESAMQQMMEYKGR